MKKIICIVLTMVLLLSTATPVFAEDGTVRVELNGTELQFDVPPQLINGRTMVPMRKIFEAMGANVEWEESTQTIIATKQETTITMQIENLNIKVNGDNILLDVSPKLIDGRTLVPARAVAESLKAQVEWDDSTKTVIIKYKEENPLTAIDLNKQKDFVCNVGATITYGFDDIWNRTVGTEYIPYVKLVDSAYRNQTIIISTLYANFKINEDGYAKVLYSTTIKKPDGKESVAKDIVAIDGKTMPNQIIKSMLDIEYTIDENDPLGVYEFTIESKDIIGNQTRTDDFTVNFSEYRYNKNEFKSTDELLDYISYYSKDPNPDRVIDAVLYAEKNNLITYPIIFAGLVEIMAKNPYISEEAIAQFENEFGKGGTETLRLLDNTAASYMETIKNNNPPTVTMVAVTDDIGNDIMLYGATIGAYFTGASYEAVKVLANSLTTTTFSPEKIDEYGVITFRKLVETDELFRAYCTHMYNYDNSIKKDVKEKLGQMLK
ncbi:MAG: copper amine oxidase N-terminal domain-containing protein [Eubacteriales bacterium]|nr:copper amine oxidase N-terminal domain-containing protein [Eubacteriales bacterium]